MGEEQWCGPVGFEQLLTDLLFVMYVGLLFFFIQFFNRQLDFSSSEPGVANEILEKA